MIRIFLILTLVFLMNAYGYAGNMLSESNARQFPLSFAAEQISTWEQDGIRVFVGNKNVTVSQGPFHISADDAVCWFHEGEASQRTEAIAEIYFEGNVTILYNQNYEKYEQVFLRFETMTGFMINSEEQPVISYEEEQHKMLISRGEDIRSLNKEEYLSMQVSRKVKGEGIQHREEFIDIIADKIDSWEEGDKRIIVALGNVKITKKNLEIDADSVILWLDAETSKGVNFSRLPLSEFYAEGNVMMRRDDDVLIADKIFEYAQENKGILIDGKIKTTLKKRKDRKLNDLSPSTYSRKRKKKSILENLPAYVRGEEIRHMSEGQYEIKNGKISTCGYGHPHYHFKGRKIRLVQSGDHNIVSSRGNTFYIGKYPVAYFPYLSFDITEKEKLLRDWEFGSSSRFGAFLKTDWDLYAVTGGSQKDWSDLIFKFDYLQERGLGTGLDFDYQGKDRFGYAETYYLNDHGDFDINRVPIEQEDRGMALWRHRHSLPYHLRLDMEYSHLSDPGFLREFYREKFKREKDHETVFYLRRLYNNTAATFLINQQLNGFDTTVDSLRENSYAEQLPEIAYRIIGEPILNNRFLFTSQSSVTYFNNIIRQNTDTVEPEAVTRFDTVNRISIPFKPWVFNIKPFFEGRTTAYSESIDTSNVVGETGEHGIARFISTFGLDWSSTHWRTYSVYNEFFNINRLRHIFIPELRYIYNPVVTKDPVDIYQHDEIDALDKSQTLVVGVKNILQTKRGKPGFEKTVDFINFNIDYYVFPSDAGAFNEGINGIIIRNDDFVNFDFRWNVTDYMTFASERNEFNLEEIQFDVLSYGVELYSPPDWEFFAGHRYIRDISSTIMLAADYQINEKWSILAEEKYDLRSTSNKKNEEKEKTNLKTSFMLSHHFHDWVGSLTLELDPIRNDSSYRFDITPKGLQRTARRFWF